MASNCTSRLFTKLLRCPEPMLPMPTKPTLMRWLGGGVCSLPMAEEGTISGVRLFWTLVVFPLRELQPPAATAAAAEPFRNRRREKDFFITHLQVIFGWHGHCNPHSYTQPRAGHQVSFPK